MEEGKIRGEKKVGKRLSRSFTTGAIALVFLIIGFETALFIHKAAVLHILAGRDAPDTVYVYVSAPGSDGVGDAICPDRVAERQAAPTPSGPDPSVGENYYGKRTGDITDTPSSGSRSRSIRKNAAHSEGVQAVRAAYRRVESFPFDPNSVSAEDLQRLGFSEKQALSIVHYREKGGRFRRKADFAKSFVVADSVYRRLEAYITIPRIDLNRADSAAFETLPGVGKWYAARMVSYRSELGGYSYPEQLMDLPHFDREKFDALKDLITVGPSEPFGLWTLPEEALARHPYIGRRAARGIVLYRDNNPREALSVEGLRKAGVLPEDRAAKLARCRLAEP